MCVQFLFYRPEMYYRIRVLIVLFDYSILIIVGDLNSGIS